MTTEAANSAVEQYRKAFNKHASLEAGNDRFMTKDDFLAAIAPGEDFAKIKREQYGLLYKIAATSDQDRISFNDFVIFQNLLSKPDAEYEVAFRLFDVNNTGKITYDQFKQVLSSNLPSDAVPFDFDCDWLKLYIGNKEGHYQLTYEEFSQLLKGLQGERLRQEFKHYDQKQTGYISTEHFKRIILDIAQHKLSDLVIDHLPTLCNLYATGSGTTISFSNMVAFHNVIRNIDMVELVIRRAIAANQENAITKQDFLSQAAKTSRYSLFTPMEADIIFHFAAVDSNGSGRLSLDDFEKILDPRWRPITQQEQQRLSELGSQQKVATGGEKEKHGFLWEVVGNMYSFTLGSIAGAVGATAVYPIDLVKTRMQNQRSKVVGELLYKNSLDCFRKVVKNEGFVGLYRGLGPQLVVSLCFVNGSAWR